MITILETTNGLIKTKVTDKAVAKVPLVVAAALNRSLVRLLQSPSAIAAANPAASKNGIIVANLQFADAYLAISLAGNAVK